jgi:hypothetical protein
LIAAVPARITEICGCIRCRSRSVTVTSSCPGSSHHGGMNPRGRTHRMSGVRLRQVPELPWRSTHASTDGAQDKQGARLSLRDPTVAHRTLAHISPTPAADHSRRPVFTSPSVECRLSVFGASLHKIDSGVLNLTTWVVW